MRVYRASSLGYSLEQLVAPHLGYDPVSPPDFLQVAYDEGNRLEPIVITALRDRGWVISGEQDEVEIVIIPDAVIIQGHIDGYAVVDGVRYVLEVKTMAHAAWVDFEKNGWGSKSALIEKYKWQQSAYCIATGLPHFMVAWDKSTENIIYKIQNESIYPVETLANKVLAAEQYIRDGVLPEGCEDFPCPFFYLHADKEKVPVEKADEQLEELLGYWLAYDKIEKSAKAFKDELRKLIVGEANDSMVVGKIKGSNGVTVSTNWVEEKHVEYDVKAHWETRIQGPRNAAK